MSTVVDISVPRVNIIYSGGLPSKHNIMSTLEQRLMFSGQISNMVMCHDSGRGGGAGDNTVNMVNTPHEPNAG